jgi:hypothetical protein
MVFTRLPLVAVGQQKQEGLEQVLLVIIPCLAPLLQTVVGMVEVLAPAPDKVAPVVLVEVLTTQPEAQEIHHHNHLLVVMALQQSLIKALMVD